MILNPLSEFVPYFLRAEPPPHKGQILELPLIEAQNYFIHIHICVIRYILQKFSATLEISFLKQIKKTLLLVRLVIRNWVRLKRFLEPVYFYI